MKISNWEVRHGAKGWLTISWKGGEAWTTTIRSYPIPSSRWTYLLYPYIFWLGVEAIREHRVAFGLR